MMMMMMMKSYKGVPKFRDWSRDT